MGDAQVVSQYFLTVMHLRESIMYSIGASVGTCMLNPSPVLFFCSKLPAALLATGEKITETPYLFSTGGETAGMHVILIGKKD